MKFSQASLSAVAVVIAATLLAAGCAPGDKSSGISRTGSHTSSEARSGLDLAADVDPASGRVTLPADRFFPTSAESALLFSAASAATAACAREIDIPWTGYRIPIVTEYEMKNYFGPWTKEMAERFAFVKPMSDDELIGNGVVEEPAGYVPRLLPNTQLSEEQGEIVGKKCSSDSQAKKFDRQNLDGRGPWNDELSKASDDLLKDARAKKVVAELRACFSAHGMTLDEEYPGYITAVKNEITEEQIALALKVVECQQKTDATKRLVDVWGSLQAPIIEKYADELVAQRARIDKALEEAKSYVAQHPELFEAPK